MNQHNYSSIFDMMKNEDYLILDTETTGLRDAEACQIAIISNTGDTLLNSLVKTKRGIPRDAQRIHGISDETVKDAPTWLDLWPTVREIIASKHVAIYNAPYDLGVLRTSNRVWGIEEDPYTIIRDSWCAMIAFSPIYGEWNDYYGNYKWQRLSVAAEYCGVPVIDAHDAYADCQMTLGVCRWMLARGQKNHE